MRDESKPPDGPDAVPDQDPQDDHLSNMTSFDAFNYKHRPYIEGACERIAHGRGVNPAETYQNALLQAWKDWPELRLRWVNGRIAGIVVRATYAAKRLRRDPRRPQPESLDAQLEKGWNPVARGMDPARFAATKQKLADLAEILATLDEMELAVWELARSGIGQQGIAYELEVDIAEVRRLLDRANRKIRRGLRRRGYDTGEGDDS